MYYGQRWTRFHFKLDNSLYDKLLAEAEYWGYSVSEIIDKILKKSYKFIQKVEFTKLRIENEDFMEDQLNMNVDLKISIGEKFKNKLFIFQSIFRLKSKAAILRYIIRKYFEKLERWFRGEKRARRDVCKRWNLKWENDKILMWNTSFGFWWKKTVHMDRFVMPRTKYIYDIENRLCLIIHKE